MEPVNEKRMRARRKVVAWATTPIFTAVFVFILSVLVMTTVDHLIDIRTLLLFSFCIGIPMGYLILGLALPLVYWLDRLNCLTFASLLGAFPLIITGTLFLCYVDVGGWPHQEEVLDMGITGALAGFLSASTFSLIAGIPIKNRTPGSPTSTSPHVQLWKG